MQRGMDYPTLISNTNYLQNPCFISRYGIIPPNPCWIKDLFSITRLKENREIYKTYDTYGPEILPTLEKSVIPVIIPANKNRCIKFIS